MTICSLCGHEYRAVFMARGRIYYRCSNDECRANQDYWCEQCECGVGQGDESDHEGHSVVPA